MRGTDAPGETVNVPENTRSQHSCRGRGEGRLTPPPPTSYRGGVWRGRDWP